MTGRRIETPNDYFAKAAPRDYAGNVGMALLRELAANAVDAGATEVRFDFGPGHLLTATDNGSGCTAHRVQNGLLNLLGSAKEPESIGGFGRAKELLYFANPAWRIRTQDVEAVGNYLTVADFREGLAYQPGFAAEVALPEGLYKAARSAAGDFLSASHVTGVRWFLDGREHDPVVTTGKRAAKDFGYAKAYVERGVEDDRVYVRTRGLLTGTRWGYHGRDVGRVVLEVTGKSWEVLTPSRDWFARDEHRREVEHWLNQLVVAARVTLADDVGDEVLFEDYSPFEAPVTKATVEIAGRPARQSDSLPDVGGIKAEVRFTASHVTQDGPVSDPAALVNILREADAAASASAPDAQRPVTPKAPPRSDGFDMGLLPRVEGVAHVVVHTGGRRAAKAGMKWLKKHAEEAEVTLASWATAVRVVAARNGLPLDAVGFTFADGADAEFVQSQGRFGMLINPTRFDVSAEDGADELLDRALHEAAHLFHSGHDEAFVSTEFLLRRKVRGFGPRGAVARSLRMGVVAALEE